MALNRFHGAIDTTQLKHTWKGEWSEGQIYYINEVVRQGGRSYVCNSTELSDNSWYGKEYEPGVDTTHWKEFVDGYLYKGQWRVGCNWNKGDVVKYNGDYYVCLEDNKFGHPIYENSELTTKWRLIFKSTDRAKHKRHIWNSSWDPMGWSRNYSADISRGSPWLSKICTINGNFDIAQLGKVDATYDAGIGQHAAFNDYSNAAGSDVWMNQKTGGADHWDWVDGYLPTPTGEAPRVIQCIHSYSSSIILYDNGEVYLSGYNAQGNMGIGDTTTRFAFTRIGRNATQGRGTGTLRDVKIIKVSISNITEEGSHNEGNSLIFLSSDGRVFTSGYNGHGQLGIGDVTARTFVYEIPTGHFDGKKVIDVWTAGNVYPVMVARTEDDNLYVWGYTGNSLASTNTNIYTPQKILYDFSIYGGIKKVMIRGHGTANYMFVLTNDGKLHMAGYINHSGMSHIGAGSDGNANYMSPVMVEMNSLISSQLNSLGLDGIKQLGPLLEINGSIEDFWCVGQVYPTLYLKQKKTGVIFVLGGNNYSLNSTLARSMTMNEYHSNQPVSVGAVSFPTPVYMGNFNNVVQVAGVGPHYDASTFRQSAAFLNEDGRVMTNGSRGLSIRGLGSQAQVDVLKPMQNSRLPWELTVNQAYSNAQIRWTDPVSMIFVGPNYTSSTSGMSLVTHDDRLVYAAWLNTYPDQLDPGTQNSQVSPSQPFYGRADY